MSILAWILLLFGLLALLLFGARIYESDQSGSGSFTAYCVAAEPGDVSETPHCSPQLINGKYQLPESGVVIHAAVNNGTVAPEDQRGYDIEVDAGGTVTVQETKPSSGPGTPVASATTVRTFSVEDWQIQSLLASIDGCGFFYLPQLTNDEIANTPVGGGADDIQISLNDGNWNVAGWALPALDQTTLAGCQQVIAEFAGVTTGA